MSISLSQYQFEGPYPLTLWSAPSAPGLYCILTLSHNGYRPIYIGETEDLSNRGIHNGQHHKFSDWVKVAGGRSKLYVSTHQSLGCYSSSERLKIEAALVAQFSPPCNEQNPLKKIFPSLFHRGQNEM